MNNEDVSNIGSTGFVKRRLDQYEKEVELLPTSVEKQIMRICHALGMSAHLTAEQQTQLARHLRTQYLEAHRVKMKGFDGKLAYTFKGVGALLGTMSGVAVMNGSFPGFNNSKDAYDSLSAIGGGSSNFGSIFELAQGKYRSEGETGQQLASTERQICDGRVASADQRSQKWYKTADDVNSQVGQVFAAGAA